VHPDYKIFIISLVLFRITMQTLRLVSSLLPFFCFWIKLFFLYAGFQVHSEIIESLASLQKLWIFFLLFKKVIWPIMSLNKVLRIFFLNFWFFLDYCATEMLLILFAFANLYLVIIEINERSFLICREEMVLLLNTGPFKRFHRSVVKSWWAEISSARMSCSEMLF